MTEDLLIQNISTIACVFQQQSIGIFKSAGIFLLVDYFDDVRVVQFGEQGELGDVGRTIVFRYFFDGNKLVIVGAQIYNTVFSASEFLNNFVLACSCFLHCLFY